MKLFVPHIGVSMTLSQDWNFLLMLEKRNGAFIKAIGIGEGTNLPQFGSESRQATLPAGTVLEVKDYSVRRGRFAQDSRIAFITRIDGERYSFWVSLDQVEKIRLVRPD